MNQVQIQDQIQGHNQEILKNILGQFLPALTDFEKAELNKAMEQDLEKGEESEFEKGGPGSGRVSLGGGHVLNFNHETVKKIKDLKDEESHEHQEGKRQYRINREDEHTYSVDHYKKAGSYGYYHPIGKFKFSKSVDDELEKGGPGSGRKKEYLGKFHNFSSNMHAHEARRIVDHIKKRGHELPQTKLAELYDHAQWHHQVATGKIDKLTGEKIKKTKEKVEKAFENLLKGEGDRGGKVVGHTKSGKPIYENLKRFQAKQYHNYQFGKPAEAAKEIIAHHSELHGKMQEASKKAGSFSSPGLEHAYKKDLKAIHEGTKNPTKHLQEYHEATGEDNEYRAGKTASKELIGHVKNYHEKFNASAKKAGEFLEPGVRHAAKKDMEKSFEDDLEKSNPAHVGGKVIGHTESGKPIYKNAKHESHIDFTKKDHEDAANIHKRLLDEKQQKAKHHEKQMERHLRNMSLAPEEEVIKKAFENLLGPDVFEKGAKGEGSKGGKIIGHTKSGKPVYEKHSANHEVYNNFNSQDHKDASIIHATKHMAAKTDESSKHHDDLNVEHNEQYKVHKQHEEEYDPGDTDQNLGTSKDDKKTKKKVEKFTGDEFGMSNDKKEEVEKCFDRILKGKKKKKDDLKKDYMSAEGTSAGSY